MHKNADKVNNLTDIMQCDWETVKCIRASFLVVSKCLNAHSISKVPNLDCCITTGRRQLQTSVPFTHSKWFAAIWYQYFSNIHNSNATAQDLQYNWWYVFSHSFSFVNAWLPAVNVTQQFSYLTLEKNNRNRQAKADAICKFRNVALHYASLLLSFCKVIKSK